MLGRDPRRPVGGARPQRPREVQYEYTEPDAAAAEAERLWNDSEPTVPGLITVPPEATPPPTGQVTSVEIDTSVDVISMAPVRRRGGRLRALALIAAMLTGAAGLRQWAMAQRRSPSQIVLARPTAISVAELPRPAPPAPPPPSSGGGGGDHAPSEVDVLPVSVPVLHHHRHSNHQQRDRRGDTAADLRAPDLVDVEPGMRPRRTRLRPIDTADPFAP